MTRVTMHDFQDSSWNHSRGYLSTGSWLGQNGSYRESSYRSNHGVVEIYEQIGRHEIVSMRFIHDGREHMRRWDTSWGDKTLARLAREFVETIICRDLQRQGKLWIEHQ